MKLIALLVILVVSADGMAQMSISPASNSNPQRPRRSAPRPKKNRRDPTPAVAPKPQAPTGPFSDIMKCTNFLGSQVSETTYHIESPTHHYIFQERGMGCIRENDLDRPANTAGFLQITAAGARFCPLPEGTAGLAPGRPNRFSVGGSSVTYPRQTGGQVVNILANFREERCCVGQNQGLLREKVLMQKKSLIERFATSKQSARSAREISAEITPHCGADSEKIVNAALGVDTRTSEASMAPVEH
ncbi:MAG: hypothetical protein K2Q26_15120 [Bdellovibrionales bacterium]|nr:hypothetical protein [Bdellovibrionales bacterium]